jgi:hypothetical protein
MRLWKKGVRGWAKESRASSVFRSRVGEGPFRLFLFGRRCFQLAGCLYGPKMLGQLLTVMVATRAFQYYLKLLLVAQRSLPIHSDSHNRLKRKYRGNSREGTAVYISWETAYELRRPWWRCRRYRKKEPLNLIESFAHQLAPLC